MRLTYYNMQHYLIIYLSTGYIVAISYQFISAINYLNSLDLDNYKIYKNELKKYRQATNFIKFLFKTILITILWPIYLYKLIKNK